MFPVGDFLRTRTTPWVNWTLIVLNVLVFIYTFSLGDTPDRSNFGLSQTDLFFYDWGFVPACMGDYFGVATDASARDLALICPPGDRELLQPFTSMFIHAGWAHIAGNMLFLWIFGDNVEDRIGHGRYILFYLACGLAAAAAQSYMALDTVVPAVGASGAIAGVLGAYLMMYPKVRVQVIVLPLFFLPFFVPAALLIGIWFVMQLFSGLAEVGNATAGSGVAWWTHVGGFVAGAVLIWFLKRPARPQRSRRFTEDRAG